MPQTGSFYYIKNEIFQKTGTVCKKGFRRNKSTRFGKTPQKML